MNVRQYSLSLSGVNCMNCVGKITSALKEIDPDISFIINDKKDRAELITILKPEQAIQVITEAGYLSALITRRHYSTSVANVSCQHCVKKITSRIKEIDTNADIEVDISAQRLTVQSYVDDSQIEHVLQDLGYSDTQGEPEPYIQNSIGSDNETADFGALAEKGSAKKETVHLALQGVTCASCVNTIERALTNLQQIESVDINFANRTATVHSRQSADTLIRAIQSVGYDAKEIVDKDVAEDEKTEREVQEYRLKVKQSIIGLGVGIPLMAYGFFWRPDECQYALRTTALAGSGGDNILYPLASG